MTDSEQYPSYIECVEQVLSTTEESLDIDDLLAQIGQLRPLSPGARSAVHRALGKLFQAVSIGSGQYAWFSSLLNGTSFRHPLTKDELHNGYILLDELEHAVFYPGFFQNHMPEARSVRVELFGGPTIVAEAYIERKTWSLSLGDEFTHWVDEQGGQARDSLIIMVQDAAAGEYILRLQPYEVRDDKAIQNRNAQLALAAEELIAENHNSRKAMPVWELAARLVGTGLFHAFVPPDDLHYVLHHYSVLQFTAGFGYSLQKPADEGVYTPRARWDDESARRSMPSRSTLSSAPVDEWSDDEMDYADDEGRDWSTLDTDDYEGGIELEDDESCSAYQAYLSRHQEEEEESPLSHHHFHLLEAELEYLVALEIEFGDLLPEQEIRKNELAKRLFIDPQTLSGDDFDVSDYPDYPDYEDPPFWEN